MGYKRGHHPGGRRYPHGGSIAGSEGQLGFQGGPVRPWDSTQQGPSMHLSPDQFGGGIANNPLSLVGVQALADTDGPGLSGDTGIGIGGGEWGGIGGLAGAAGGMGGVTET